MMWTKFIICEYTQYLTCNKHVSTYYNESFQDHTLSTSAVIKLKSTASYLGRSSLPMVLLAKMKNFAAITWWTVYFLLTCCTLSNAQGKIIILSCYLVYMALCSTMGGFYSITVVLLKNCKLVQQYIPTACACHQNVNYSQYQHGCMSTINMQLCNPKVLIHIMRVQIVCVQYNYKCA